jgi:NADH:ubiquinone oxidoreductase subunit K
MNPAALPLLQNALTVGAILFSLGLVGILTRRNLIVMFLSAELMLQGISVSLVAWSRYHGDFGGHVLVIFVLTVAACEAAVALVFVLQAFARTGRLGAADALFHAAMVRHADGKNSMGETLLAPQDFGTCLCFCFFNPAGQITFP